MPVYVNVYSVTRHYGGPEEGGWWYNAGEPVESRIVPNREAAETLREEMEEKHGKGHGNIYSVLGGVKIEVLIEDEFASAYPREPMYYE